MVYQHFVSFLINHTVGDLLKRQMQNQSCHYPAVPALSIRGKCEPRPLFLTRFANTASAMGERQMLPIGKVILKIGIVRMHDTLLYKLLDLKDLTKANEEDIVSLSGAWRSHCGQE